MSQAMNVGERIWYRGEIATHGDELVVVLTDGTPFNGSTYPYMVEALDSKVVALADRDKLTAPPVTGGHVLGRAAGDGVVVGAQARDVDAADPEWDATIELGRAGVRDVAWTCEHRHPSSQEAIRCGARKLDQPVPQSAKAFLDGLLASKK